ncbi:hypothetical protein [Romboutsia sp.]|uniref:hypothetical protein n=1 Tax=Romboutsia sp. TaxID=1965302 RepID=UPI002C0586F1|nr:hypothetical protein [Romboutsia sp.]HSQ90090.1 hypothetical protein [Romboutsia sp.]
MAICGQYTVPYIQNLEYVSQGLLNIINGQILPGITPAAPIFIGDCEDLPTDDSQVFDCDDWIRIKDLLIKLSDDPADTEGLLLTLCNNLVCIIETVPMNYGLKAQFERFRCLCESLESRIDSIHCIRKCEEVIGDLLCLLIQLLTKLISVVSKAATLVYYADCVFNQKPCDKTIPTFFECMTCDFVNDLCELEKLVPELSAIVMAFISCDMENCTPCGTAKCACVKPRPICPPNMMHGCCHGHKPPYGYGYKPGGCGCGYKK